MVSVGEINKEKADKELRALLTQKLIKVRKEVDIDICRVFGFPLQSDPMTRYSVTRPENWKHVFHVLILSVLTVCSRVGNKY